MIRAEEIPSVNQKQMKILGRWYRELNDKGQGNKTHKLVDRELKSIDNTTQSGILKWWILQFGLYPMIWCLLQV